MSTEKKELQMRERPILFKGEMVRAIIEGRKTQTRRVLKKLPEYADIENHRIISFYDALKRKPEEAMGQLLETCPYEVGQHLWVRETWMPCGDHAHYRATDMLPEDQRWEPSIYMPRKLSRINLEITDIRVQRVQSISERDAQAEGAEIMREVLWDKITAPLYQDAMIGSPTECFANYWDSINAKRGFGWEVNPWVWVIEFRRCSE
jgi:hypothetical protein